MKKINLKQRKIFDLISNSGKLVFATGKDGVSANLVGSFCIRTNSRGEDQLDVDDGTHHVHIDWAKVFSVHHSDFHGEGKLSFKDKNSEDLFYLYRIECHFDKELQENCGLLID